jgi:hypothetical protein
MASIKVVDRFIDQLERVAALGREAAEFQDLVSKHEASSLAQILNRVKPVMEYIDGPIATREEWVYSDNPRDRQTFYYKEPGIVLVNNFESTVRDAHGRMNYSGYKVIFTRSGKLVQLDRRGSISDSAQGQGSFWSSDAHELDVTTEFAERHLQECLRSIVAAIERATERQRARRDILKDRLRVLKEVSRLLEGTGASSTAGAPPSGDDSSSSLKRVKPPPAEAKPAPEAKAQEAQ